MIPAIPVGGTQASGSIWPLMIGATVLAFIVLPGGWKFVVPVGFAVVAMGTSGI